MMGKTIAIFGGSFDPPHIGHEKIVYTALKALKDIEQLVVVPAYLSPFKNSSFLDSKTRFSLVYNLFKDVEKVMVTDFEIKQQKQVYTIDTVKYLKQKLDAQKIYLIIGADNVSKLHLWHQYEQLKQLVEFVVVSRKDHAVDFNTIFVDVDVSSTQIRKDLDLDCIPKKIKNEVKKIWNKE